MAPGRRGGCFEHHLANIGDLPKAAFVSEMEPQTSEARDARCVNDAHVLSRIADREPSVEHERGLVELSGVERLNPLPGLEDVKGPVLAVALGFTRALVS